MIYPWHQAVWQQLTEHWQYQPNAWLLVGKENIGKTAFAHELARALLCEQTLANHQACGKCSSCHLFALGTHPDFYSLTPDEAEGETAARKLLQIKIEAVRQILEPLMQSSVRGGRKVVLINPAESMNIQAANALLKVLEEPPQSVVFILVSHSRDRLLPTIKSRCRQLALPMPTQQEALAYLQAHHIENAENLLAFHGGAPLFEVLPEQVLLQEKLLAILAQPRLLAILDYAAEFDKAKQALALILDWLHKWLIDLCLVSQNMQPLYYPAYEQQLHYVAQKTTSVALFAFLADLNRLKPYGYHSLNVKMQAEDVLMKYLMVISGK